MHSEEHFPTPRSLEDAADDAAGGVYDTDNREDGMNGDGRHEDAAPPPARSSRSLSYSRSPSPFEEGGNHCRSPSPLEEGAQSLLSFFI